MSDKPPVGLRPRWLVLEERHAEICDAMKRYDERALLPPDEWLLELKEIEDQLAELPFEPAPQPPAPAAKPAPTIPQPRRFVSISRTIVGDEDHIFDAIADDGTAWCLRMSLSRSWRPISPLPAREVPADA